MVVQRDQKLVIRGWTDTKQPVAVSFNGQHLQIQADKRGSWQVEFAPNGFWWPLCFKHPVGQ